MRPSRDRGKTLWCNAAGALPRHQRVGAGLMSAQAPRNSDAHIVSHCQRRHRHLLSLLLVSLFVLYPSHLSMEMFCLTSGLLARFFASHKQTFAEFGRLHDRSCYTPTSHLNPPDLPKVDTDMRRCLLKHFLPYPARNCLDQPQDSFPQGRIHLYDYVPNRQNKGCMIHS